MNPSATVRTAIAVACAFSLGGCQAGAPSTQRVVVQSAKGGSDLAPPSATPVTTSRTMPAPVAQPARAPAPAVQATAGALAPAVVARGSAPRAQAKEFALAGFNVYEADGGRLWVFRAGSEDLASFLAKGEPAKRVTLIGAGPGGRTLMGADTDDMTDYANSMRYRADGYAVIADKGRLWVFDDGGANHESFLAKGEPAKRVTLIGEGPAGLTLLGADADVMRAYAAGVRYALPGYAVLGTGEGRLWVFRAGSADHTTFTTKGEPAKRVTLIGAGPDGRTLLGADQDDLRDYADSWRFAAPGYIVVADEGRLWVFRAGSGDLAEFVAKGEPAKRVILIGAGPDGRTLMGSDTGTLEDYARSMP